MAKEQKVVNVTRGDGQYHNFWRYGGWGRFKDYLDNGWIAIHIKDDPEREEATVIFERDL